MLSFFQSAFLQALGYAITNSLWQVALLWIIVVLITSIGKVSSTKKYFVAVLAQFAGFVWFLCTLEFYYLRCSEALLQFSGQDIVNNYPTYAYTPVIDSFSSALLYGIVKAQQILPYLSIAYLCMLLFLALRLSRSFYFTKKICSQELQKADIELRLFVRRTAAYMSIKKQIKVYVSNLVKSPLTIGFIRPLILIPVASINHLTADQMEAVLLHELAHIKRADYLINILQSVIEIILFFNPFIQLIGKLTKKERENSCDDFVLQFQYNPAMYAEALLQIACTQAQPVFTINATGNEGDLLSRIKRMLNKQEKTYNYSNQIFSLFLITVMLTTVAWLNPVVKKNVISIKKQPIESNNVIAEPLFSGVNNPFFNPIYFLGNPIQQKLNNQMNSVIEEMENKEAIIAETRDKILAQGTPAAEQVLKDASEELNKYIDKRKELVSTDQSKIIPNISFSDEVTFRDAFKNILSDRIDAKNFVNIQTEIHKVQLELAALSKQKYLNNSTSIVVNNTLKSTLGQLKELKVENVDILRNSLQNLRLQYQSKTPVSLQLEEAVKKLENEYRKYQKKDTKKKVQLKKYNQNNEDGDIDDETNDFSYYSELNNIESSNVSHFYTPVVYNDLNEINHVADSTGTEVKSALIIVKYNSANDTSYTKHITIDITGDNGARKTMELTVEVYQ